MVGGRGAEALKQRGGHRGIDHQRDAPEEEAVDDAAADAEARLIP
jgi:hypothetical protein